MAIALIEFIELHNYIIHIEIQYIMYFMYIFILWPVFIYIYIVH